MRLIDYVYYRYAKFFNKYDGLEKGDLYKKGYSYTALLMTSLSQMFFAVILYVIYEFRILKVKSYIVTTELKYIVILIAFSILLFNFLRYRKRLYLLEEKWSKQNKRQRYLGNFFVLLYFLFPFIFLVIVMKFNSLLSAISLK